MPDCTKEIRLAQPIDAPRLAVLATQVWTHTYAKQGINDEIALYVLNNLTPDYFLQCMQQASQQLWVAENKQHLLALALVDTESACPVSQHSHVELKTLYVQAHFSGQGLGTALLHQAERLAADRQQPLWLSVNAQNNKAMQFYHQHQYQQHGEIFFDLGQSRHKNWVMLQAQHSKSDTALNTLHNGLQELT